MSQVGQLYKLQLIDTEIRQKKGRLSEVIRLQQETEELKAARKRDQAASEELQRWQRRQNDLDLELGTLNSEAKRTNQRLYSGNVKNPKELEDLEHKVAELSRRAEALEDEILEAMIMIEEAQEEKDQASHSLAEIEDVWKRAQQHLQEEQNELALLLHRSMEARGKQVALIEKSLLAKYDLIKTRKGGVAVAGLQDNRCGGCHLTVSANKAKQAEQGEIVTCGSCGRILNPL
jgi:predicted  nucleic acid-binding Zn-ribbon protein